MNIWLRSIFFVMSAFLFSSAQAVDGFSRACRWDWIPTTAGLDKAAAYLFQALGAPAVVGDLPSYPVSAKQNYWILESITADYLRVRYYLYAESAIYRKVENTPGVQWSYVTRRGTPWTAVQISQALLKDSNLSMFMANRKLGYSARAGASSIVEYYPNITQFLVMGDHYYYDPVSKVQSHLGQSSASDCNLSNWGFNDWLSLVSLTTTYP